MDKVLVIFMFWLLFNDIVNFSVPVETLVNYRTTTFFKNSISWAKYLVFPTKCAKTEAFQKSWFEWNTRHLDRNARFLIEMPVISFEILGFSFEIKSIWKIFDNPIYPVSPQK